MGGCVWLCPGSLLRTLCHLQPLFVTWRLFCFLVLGNHISLPMQHSSFGTLKDGIFFMLLNQYHLTRSREQSNCFTGAWKAKMTTLMLNKNLVTKSRIYTCFQLILTAFLIICLLRSQLVPFPPKSTPSLSSFAIAPWSQACFPELCSPKRLWSALGVFKFFSFFS